VCSIEVCAYGFRVAEVPTFQNSKVIQLVGSLDRSEAARASLRCNSARGTFESVYFRFRYDVTESGASFGSRFYRRDAALLARLLAMALRPSVSMQRSESVTSQSSIETAERIGLVFGMRSSFDLSETVL